MVYRKEVVTRINDGKNSNHLCKDQLYTFHGMRRASSMTKPVQTGEILNGTSDTNRTYDLLFRGQSLYPTELQK